MWHGSVTFLLCDNMETKQQWNNVTGKKMSRASMYFGSVQTSFFICRVSAHMIQVRRRWSRELLCLVPGVRSSDVKAQGNAHLHHLYFFFLKKTTNWSQKKMFHPDRAQLKRAHYLGYFPSLRAHSGQTITVCDSGGFLTKKDFFHFGQWGFILPQTSWLCYQAGNVLPQTSWNVHSRKIESTLCPIQSLNLRTLDQNILF